VNPVRISVVIATFERRCVLERTLPSLLAQDFPPGQYEIIVVVDGSTDGTAPMLRGLKHSRTLRILESSHRGPSAARNAGIQAAVGELVLLLDDDLICPGDLVRQHCSSHAESDRSLVHGPIYVAPDSAKSIVRCMTERFYESHYRPLDPAMELRFPEKIGSSLVLSSMANSSMPREALLASGGFDEQLLGAEDLELGLRLWKMGVRFRFRPEAAVQELYVKTSREYLRGIARALTPGDLYIARRHPEYRPHAALSGLAETRWWKRWLRDVVARAPVSPVPLMALPFLLERQLYRFGPMREAGLRLLNYATVVARLRGARKAAGSWRAVEDEFGRRLPVLMYHHVGPLRPGTLAALTVSPERFERHVRWLARRGFVGVRPSDWLRWLRDGGGLPAKPILFTFDDGYADIAEYALPVLRRHGFSAAVFIVTAQVGGTNAWDEVQGSGTHRLMTAEQIRHWAAEGIEFGAHSRTHPDLRELSAPQLTSEITGSKHELACILGSAVRFFAYPYGEVSTAAHDIVRDEFELAFSVERGMNYLRTDPHLLRRIDVGPEDSVLDIENHTHWDELQPLAGLRARLQVRSRFRKVTRRLMRLERRDLS